MPFSLRRLAHGFGAEISGINLREPVSEHACGEIHCALLDHRHVLFRDQSLTTEQHIASATGSARSTAC